VCFLSTDRSTTMQKTSFRHFVQYDSGCAKWWVKSALLKTPLLMGTFPVVHWIFLQRLRPLLTILTLINIYTGKIAWRFLFTSTHGNIHLSFLSFLKMLALNLKNIVGK
jgi:hypothetical protein